MAKGFKHGGGGSSVTASLNFKVIGGTTSSSNASANTIWVNTDKEITSWVFSPVEPEAENGMVWIKTALASDATFNALKENGIILCLSKAYQASDGEFSPVDASIYNGDSWVSFSTFAVYLYIKGDVCESVTGGYVAEAMSAASSDSGKSAPSVTYGESSMVISPVKSTAAGIFRGGILRTNSKIDFSQYSTLIFEGSVEIVSGTARLCAWSEIGTVQNDNMALGSLLANGSDPVEVDVSDLDGSYYIGFGFDSQNVQMTVTVDSLRLE